MSSLKKLWNDYGVGAIIVLIVVAYGVNVFANYLTNKGRNGTENMSQDRNPAYKNKPSNSQPNPTQSSMGVQPSEPLGQNEVFSAVNGISTPSGQIPTGCSKPNVQNPADLLPKDTNSQWAQLNPAGKGELSNINLLKAGYHIGIDTIGQSLRNANLQIRSEIPNPQLYTGPWNNSSITSDYMRVPLEIGSTTYQQ
jgi:hypothetical protein